jgi:ribosome-associated protein
MSKRVPTQDPAPEPQNALTGDAAADAPQDEVARPSRTKKKLQAQAVDKLGERLVALSDKLLTDLPLSGELRDAIAEAKRTHSHIARRRQLLFVGRLLRASQDPATCEQIAAAFEEVTSPRPVPKDVLERWRDRLLAGEMDVQEELLAAFARAQRQRLRQLVRRAKTAEVDSAPVRALMLYLGEVMAPERHAD